MEPEAVTTSVIGSPRRSFLLAANSFMDPILEAAALFLRTGNFSESSLISKASVIIGDFAGDFDKTFLPFLDDFTGDEPDFICATSAFAESMLAVALLNEAGDTITTLRLLTRRVVGLLGDLVGEAFLFFALVFLALLPGVEVVSSN